MKKWLLSMIAFCCLISLSGCTSTKQKNEEKINMTVFTVSTCSNCKAFKEYAIPALENEFGDQLVLTIKDLDEDENGALYDQITGQLADYDTVYSRMVPFIVVEGYFAVLAYNKGEETALISDIKAARDGKPLGDTLSNGRWLFKE